MPSAAGVPRQSTRLRASAVRTSSSVGAVSSGTPSNGRICVVVVRMTVPGSSRDSADSSVVLPPEPMTAVTPQGTPSLSYSCIIFPPGILLHLS